MSFGTKKPKDKKFKTKNKGDVQMSLFKKKRFGHHHEIALIT
jgi:hypothetical protein